MRPQKITANQKTEERILTNALHHFCSYGYNGTSVREITAASDVTKPTLYYYFENKEQLFSRLATSCFELIIKSLDDSLSRGGSFRESLISLFQTVDSVFEVNPGALRFIHAIVVSPQKGTPDVGSKKFMERLDQYVSRIVQKGVDSGEILADKHEFTKVIISALLGLHTQSVLTGISYSSTNRKLMNDALDSIVQCSKNKDCRPKF